MHNFLEITYAIQLAITFVFFVTGTWRKSYSTGALLLISLVLFYHITCNPQGITLYTVNGLSIIMVLRAMKQKHTDSFIRGGERV